MEIHNCIFIPVKTYVPVYIFFVSELTYYVIIYRLCFVWILTDPPTFSALDDNFVRMLRARQSILCALYNIIIIVFPFDL